MNKENIFSYRDNFQDIKNIGYRELINNSISDPLITICVPTFKRDDFLEASVRSIWDQTHYIPFEILISDNQNERQKAPDFLMENSSHIRYLINDSNLGMVGNWNRLILEAKGKSIFILHDDDWLQKDFFKIIEKHLKEEKAIVINYQVQDYREELIKRDEKKQLIKKFIKATQPESRNVSAGDIFFSPVNPAIYSKQKLIELGGYNQSYFPAMDGVMYTKYILFFGGIQLKQLLYNYRIQANESMKGEVFNGFIDLYKDIRLEISKTANWTKLILPLSTEFDKVNLNQDWGNLNELREKRSVKYWLYVFLRISREVLIALRLI